MDDEPALEADRRPSTGRHRVIPPSWFGIVMALGFLAAILSIFVVPTGPLAAPLTAAAMIAVMAAILTALTKRSTVFVGTDGVRVRFIGERFVPFSELGEVVLRGRHSIELRFRSGHTELLSVAPRTDRRVTKDEEARRNALYEEIRQALAAYRAAEAPGAHTPDLARNGRTTREWKDALARHAHDPTYREAGVRSDALWSVLEDARAPEAARAGAAVALVPTLDEDGRQRLRVVTEATASPRLRVALDAATGGSDESLTEALDALDDETLDPARSRVV